MVAIQLTRLSKHYQEQVVIPALDLTIPDRQITALIGPSGSGKSTILNMIAGLTVPSSGQILFDDHPVFDQQRGTSMPPAKRHLAMVFQDFALWPHMTVAGNVSFALAPKLSKSELTHRVDWALSQVGLTDLRDRYPRELSGGQQQRVALARAIAVKPKLILFDEALSALDPQLRASLQIEISRLIHQNQLTALFVTHDRQEALRIADHVVLIRDGRVVQAGSPTTLYQRPVNAFAAKFFGPLNQLDGHTAIRPEHVHLATHHPEQPKTHGQVQSSTFLGDHFDNLIDVADQQWHVSSASALPAGPVTLSFDPQYLIHY
ncbi:ABC transporter ATP-binding protein [Lactiplantibacillus plajomi]|uniref:ABC transporter ATP-binding protein n=1 Tax=Lactiplantibacillus plajomi TaxID=1457217 RepID=A0ABV6K337_9LACO|nr:ABC transporter ATP-binding protein [Lactiplantibacillus plajomi]